MFKPRALKNLIISFVFLAILLFSQNHALAQSMTFDLVKGINGISLPFEGTGINTAEDLANSIPNCDMVYYWDAENQKFVAHAKGSSENNFNVFPGYPYFVRVTEDTSWDSIRRYP